MKPQADEIFSPLQTTLKRNMLRWHVGQVIFCQCCQSSLDWRRTVEIDVLRNGQLAKSMVVCTVCFDAKVKGNAEALPAEMAAQGMPGITVAVTDGRLLQSGRQNRARKPCSGSNPAEGNAMAAADSPTGVHKTP